MVFSGSFTLLYGDAYALQVVDDLMENIRALAEQLFQSLRSLRRDEPQVFLQAQQTVERAEGSILVRIFLTAGPERFFRNPCIVLMDDRRL